MIAARLPTPALPLLGLALLLAPISSVAAQPFLQESVDAAHTSHVDGPGPQAAEIAFQLQLPGSPGGQVLLIDGAAYVLTRDAGHEGLTENALWRIDLDTGSVERLISFDPPREVPCRLPQPFQRDPGDNCYHSEMLTDGTHLYLARGGGVDKLTFDGEQVASWEHPAFFGDKTVSQCSRGLALVDDALYVLCVAFPAGQAADRPCCPNPSNGWQGQVLLARLAAGDLSQAWLWVKAPRGKGPAGDVTGQAAPSCPTGATAACPGENADPVSLAVVGPAVAVLTFEQGGADTLDFLYWGLDKATGDVLWSRNSSSAASPQRDPGSVGLTFPSLLPVGTAEELYLRVGSELQAVNPSRGSAVLWSQRVDARDPVERALPTSPALADDQLYLPSFQTLHRIDTEGQQIVWSRTLPDPGSHWFSLQDTIVADELVYAVASVGDPEFASAGVADQGDGKIDRIFYGFDRETSEIRFGQPFNASNVHNDVDSTLRYAVGDGVAVLATQNGKLLVVGRTEASITPEVDVSTTYPAPGDEIRADLGGSTPGLYGPPTKYKADWGDGTVTNWTTEPVLTHTYNETGTHEATFWAGNGAGQSSAVTQSFEVGGSPPPWYEEALTGTTGWLLGLLFLVSLLLLGAVVYRRGREDERIPTEDRLLAYREVLEAELADGTSQAGLADKLRPMRAALGISDRQHARIEETLRARFGGAGGLVVGDTFLSRYEVVEHLGTGGGGAAYLCRDTRIGRDVVLKALGEPEDAGELEGLVAEANAFGSIEHNNVVTVHDVEQVGDEVYLVLEHVAGGNLSEHLSGGSLDRARFMELAHDLLAGLEAVHEAGIVHRDIKPANVLVAAEGDHKLADFGIAGREPGTADGEEGGPGTRHTVAVQVDSVRGTIPYMSPEQARGARVDRRSDLYSAAVVLWEAFTGQRYVVPEPAETATELQMRIAQADGLPRVPEGASEEQQAWFEKALAPEPEERFLSAQEMLEALGPALG